MKKLMNSFVCIVLTLAISSVFAQQKSTEPEKTVPIEEITKLAEEGNRESQYALGRALFEGSDSLPKNDELAYVWFKKSAEQGYAQAQYLIGNMHLNGYAGVAPDHALGAVWIRKAADQGYANAQYIAGLLFANGQGVPKSEVIGDKYTYDAAIQGVALAQAIVGERYRAGRNIQANPIIAYAFFNVAASVEFSEKERTIAARDELGKLLSVEERTVAQTLSSQFVAIGIAKALAEYLEDIKKKESEALVAKLASEKAAQEEAVRQAEKAASEERTALIIDWAKKIGLAILGVVLLGGITLVVRKQLKKHKSSIESFANDKISAATAMTKNISTQIADGLINDAKFCEDCGSAMTSANGCSVCNSLASSNVGGASDKIASASEDERLGGFHLTESFINSKSFDSLVGSNIDYYREKFLRLEPIMKEQISYANLPLNERFKQASGNNERNRKLMTAGGFNWAAAIFPWIWMAYRRMYLYAAAILGTQILVSAFSSRIGIISAIFLLILSGFLGNSMYYFYLNKLLKKSNTTDYAKIGGVSPFGAMGFLGGAVMFGFVLAVVGKQNLTDANSYSGTNETSTAQEGNFIKIGGWICNDQYAAMLNVRYVEITKNGADGCSQIGARTRVNIISRIELSGFELIKVGNSGGVAWIVASDLE